MTYPVELGSVRQIWLGPVGGGGPNHSFLVRDDAYSMKAQPFGRTIRLGDPVNLGPNSSWVQLSWEGGMGQELWADKAMYQEGSADPQSHTGKLRMWSGFNHLDASIGRQFDCYKFGRGSRGSGLSTPIYIAESVRWKNPAAQPKGGYQIKRWNPATSKIEHLPGGPNAGAHPFMSLLSSSVNGAKGILIACTYTDMWFLFEDSGTWLQDTTAFGGPYGHDCLVSFNSSIYYTSNNALCKRDPDPAHPPLGIPGKHSVIRTISDAQAFSCLTVYNNRLYYCVQYPNGRAAVEVSDGVTAQRVFEFPDEFWPQAAVSHYGSLYIVGVKPAANGPVTADNPGGALGQVWRYNGSSLVKVWEDGDPMDGHSHHIFSVATYGQNLVWTRPGYPLGGVVDETQTAGSGSRATNRPCLMFYDVEKDAIFEGPGIAFPPGCTEGIMVEGVYSWDNTLAVSFFDYHNYTNPPYPVVQAAYVRLNDNVHNTFASLSGQSFEALNYNHISRKTDFILSSRYHGEDDVALETKTWLSGKLHCKIPPNTQIRVAALLDEGTEQLVATLTSDGTSDWRTLTFPMKAGGAYLQSVVLQYKVYLDNQDLTADSQAVPEVDDLYVQWRVAPQLQRTWTVRAVLQDAQNDIDGSPNTLTTRQAMLDQLTTYYEDGLPVAFWDAQADGAFPGGAGTEVVVSDFMVQTYRIDTGGADQITEAALTLVENVT